MTSQMKITISVATIALLVLGVLLMKNHHGHGVNPGSNQALNSPQNTSPEQNSLASKQIQNSETSGSTESTVATTNGKSETTLKPEEVQKAPEPTCFIATYHHKPLPSHNDEEACSHHKNLIHVAIDQKINPQSVCIRVNNTPVKFQRMKSDEFMIGAIAGPTAKITVRYCVAKVTCAEDCKIPKDEFMDAIGGSQDEDAAPKGAQAKWDPNDKEGDRSAEVDDVQRNLADVENSGATNSIFKDWIVDSNVPACTSVTQAALDKGRS